MQTVCTVGLCGLAMKHKVLGPLKLINENYMTQNFMPVSISFFFSIPTGSESDEAFLI